MQNSQTSSVPSQDANDWSFKGGMTKAEYATIHFVAAHIKAHGSFPTRQQSDSIATLAINILDDVIPSAVAQLYPSAPDHSLDDQVDPEAHLEYLE